MESSTPPNYLDLRTKQSIFIVSGPSGAGKTVLVKKIREYAGDKITRVITVTSRKMRAEEGERDGVDYYFVTPEEFEHRVEAGLFVEWAWVHGNRYGMLKSELERIYEGGGNALAVLDVQGRQSLMNWGSEELRKSIVDIFIAPPSVNELVRRIRGREKHEADEEDIETRMKTTMTEMPHAFGYRHIIVNNDVAKATEHILSVVDFYLSPDSATDESRAAALEKMQQENTAFLHSEFDHSYEFKS
jgi:guanylate kinase